MYMHVTPYCDAFIEEDSCLVNYCALSVSLSLSPLCPHLPCLQSLGSSGVYLYQPHIRAVTDFALPSSHASTNFHLLSTSTDGTLRSTDFEKGVLDLVS